MVTVSIDRAVLTMRQHGLSPNPPTILQVKALCRKVASELARREPAVMVRQFHFCIEKVYCDCPIKGHGIFHHELERLVKRKDGSYAERTVQTGGYTVRMYADGVPCAGWILGTDRFNLETLLIEWLDIADVVQLRLTGTWPHCDPDGDRRVELGLPREPGEREGSSLTSIFGLL